MDSGDFVLPNSDDLFLAKGIISLYLYTLLWVLVILCCPILMTFCFLAKGIISLHVLVHIVMGSGDFVMPRHVSMGTHILIIIIFPDDDYIRTCHRLNRNDVRSEMPLGWVYSTCGLITTGCGRSWPEA